MTYVLPPPETQRVEYNTLFEQLHKHVNEVTNNGKLVAFAHYLREDLLRQLMDIVGCLALYACR